MQLLSLCGNRDRRAHRAERQGGKQDGRHWEESADRTLWKFGATSGVSVISLT